MTLALLALPLVATAQKKDSIGTVIDEVVWVVGDEAILRSDVEALRMQSAMEGVKWSGNPDCTIPEQIAVQKLFKHQAQIDSIEVTDADVAQEVEQQISYWLEMVDGSRERLEEYKHQNLTQIRADLREEMKDRQMVQKMKQKLVEDIAVTPAEVRRYFSALPQDSLPFVPTEVEVQIVQLTPKIEQEELNRVKDELRNYTERVNKGETRFQTLAQLYSEDPGSARRGGELGLMGVEFYSNQTLFDSYVNLLRSQTEAMSAALGSVHSMVVTPFDAPYEEATDFSERIARNQQLLIKEESHFDRIVDPSAGSYYIEHLTDALATEAWKIFLKVEDEGGFLAAVKAGTVQDDINATNVKRHGDAAKRKEFLLGTNQFPNFTEKSENKRAYKHHCGCGGVHHHGEETVAFKGIESTRLAADFENLRIHTEETKVPTAFMLTIGNLAMRQARAQFSCNFLACAGYKVIDNLGFKTVEEGVDAALGE